MKYVEFKNQIPILVELIESEVSRLKKLGWTKADFVRELKKILDKD